MSASDSIKTILILGATSGIGEAFARRFHAMGKKVIATGRREANLNKLKADCPGLETYVMDVSDLANIGTHAKKLLATYPDINAVWANGGLQQSFSFKDSPTKFSDDELINEVTVNTTAPVLVAKHFLPHLQSLKTESFFMITSSGLGFMPAPAFPVYCVTKAGMHQFSVVLRQQFQDTHVRIIEIAPPWVVTDLDANHKFPATETLFPMPLQEYTDATFKLLDGNKGADLKEVAVGFADMGAKAWRGAFQPMLDHMQMGG